MPYPVAIAIEPAIKDRNRLTTAFRLILAIPHLILVGALGASIVAHPITVSSEGGLLGVVAGILAVISWFTIVIGGQHIIGIRQFTLFYLRWRIRALAYFLLLEDRYPPFGDAEYPASVTVTDPSGPRDRLTVAFRLILGI